MTRAQYESIFNLIQGICRQNGISFYPDLIRFTSVWKRTVGPYINRNTEVKRFQKGTAWICTPSPTWRYELIQMKSQLIDRLNRAYDHPIVKDIRVEIGNISSAEGDSNTMVGGEKKPLKTSLPKDEAAWVKRCVEDIADPDIRRYSERILTQLLMRSLG